MQKIDARRGEQRNNQVVSLLANCSLQNDQFIWVPVAARSVSGARQN
jgi:hypothetical protein